jgi:AbrB family looped-hinge helix DNA binding protein
MAIARVQARGQVTLPKEVRDAAGVEPGDAVIVEATGRGTVELRVVPRMTLAETFERYRIDEPVDIAADRGRWEEAAADRVLAKAGVRKRAAKRT